MLVERCLRARGDVPVGDEEIREELRAAGESEEDIEEFVEKGGADNVRDDIRLKRALDRIASGPAEVFRLAGG